jgi:hypothetical protein
VLEKSGAFFVFLALSSFYPIGFIKLFHGQALCVAVATKHLNFAIGVSSVGVGHGAYVAKLWTVTRWFLYLFCILFTSKIIAANLFSLSLEFAGEMGFSICDRAATTEANHCSCVIMRLFLR